MNTESAGARVAAAFDAAAEGYDREPLRYFAFAADRLVLRVAPVAGQKLLDIAAGTGAVTLAAAQAVAPGGRVTAIDLSEQMLARLEAKLRKFGIANVDVHVMDAARLEFRRDYFDHALCAFGIFFLPDMAAALRGWVRVVRPGGTVGFSAFAQGAFQPMRDLYHARIERYAVAPAPFTAHRLETPEQCTALLSQAGLLDIVVSIERLGYHLRRPEEWWEVVTFSALRAQLDRLPPEQLGRFRTEHLAEVAALAGPEGLRLEVPVLLASGRKPG